MTIQIMIVLYNHDKNVFVLNLEAASPKVNKFKEALRALEDVSRFLKSRENVQQRSTLRCKWFDEVAGLKL